MKHSKQNGRFISYEPHERKSKYIMTRLDDELHDAMIQYCGKFKRNKSEFLRLAVYSLLRSHDLISDRDY